MKIHTACQPTFGASDLKPPIASHAASASRRLIHRAAAGIIHTLQTMADEGHCYADRNLLIEETTALLEVPTPIVEQALTAAIDSRAVSVSEDRIYPLPLY